jgi:membrane protein DedA with SNARE-associated domain
MGDLADRIIGTLLGLPAATVYVLVGILCWAEAAFFLGFVTPGELAVAVGGILSSRGTVVLGWLVLVVVTGTMLGNTTGYYLGRRWGDRMLQWAPLQRLFGPAINSAQEFMLRRGEWAIVLGRLATPTRITVPFLAGASQMPYRRFLVFDVPATVAWAVVWATLGFILGESWEVLENVAGTAALLVLILFATALIIRWVTVRIARNQSRIQWAFRRLLVITGTQRLARRLAPAFGWAGRRLDPRLAHGLGLTVAFTVLLTGVGGVGLVLSQTRAVQGLALVDFPALEWMATVRTDDAVRVSRMVLEAFRWPGVLFLGIPLAALVAWKVGWGAALRVGVGVVGAGGGTFFLDRMVLEGIVPRAEFPSVPVAVAATMLVHATSVVARRAGWGPSVAVAGTGTFILAVVALGTLVAGWAAPSGITLGFALGLVWACALEIPPTVLGGEEDSAPEDDSVAADDDSGAEDGSVVEDDLGDAKGIMPDPDPSSC